MPDYNAPRRFSSPPTSQEADRLAEDVAELTRAVNYGTPPRIRPRLGIERGNCVLAPGLSVLIDTSGGQTARAMLPLLDSRAAGAVVCIVRLSTLGTIRVVPVNNAELDGSAAAQLCPSDRGFFLYHWDGIGWHSGRQGALPSGASEGDTIVIINNVPTWSSPQPGRLSVESDTIALFHFNDTLVDATGTYTMAAFSGAARFVHMFPGYRALFLRTNDRLGSTVLGSALGQKGAMTLEFVIHYTDRQFTFTNNRVVYHGTDSVGSSSNNCDYIVEQVAATDMSWYQMFGGGSFSGVNYDGDVPVSHTPFYCAYTRSAGQVVRPYLQGVPAGSASSALTAPTGGSNGGLIIGGPTHEVFAIAELRVSNAERTAAQIKEAYNVLLGGPYGRIA